MQEARLRLPAGLKIVARAFDEETILAIAYAYEQAAGHDLRPPDTGPLGPTGE